MSANAEPNPERATNNRETELKQATDLAILACGGDLRASIQALIVANQYLEERNRQLSAYISVGFMRSQIEADNEFEDELQTDLNNGPA